MVEIDKLLLLRNDRSVFARNIIITESEMDRTYDARI